MKCPECDNELGERARYCPCGWKRDTKPKFASSGYTQCEWIGDHNYRCQYPGSMSSNTNGQGPWFCRFHWDCNDGAYGAQVVEESKSYKPDTLAQRTAKAQQDAIAGLKAKGLDRKPNETQTQHTDRMRQWLRANFPTMKAYETRPSREPDDDEDYRHT